MSDYPDPWYADFVRRIDKAQQLNDTGYDDDEDDEPVMLPLRPQTKATPEEASEQTAEPQQPARRRRRASGDDPFADS